MSDDCPRLVGISGNFRWDPNLRRFTGGASHGGDEYYFEGRTIEEMLQSMQRALAKPGGLSESQVERLERAGFRVGSVEEFLGDIGCCDV